MSTRDHAEDPDTELTLERILRRLTIAGTPDQVAERLLELRREVGPFDTLLYTGHDWVSPELARRSMELMARARFPQLPLTVTRPFNYTGPGQAPQFVIPKLVDHFRRRASRMTLGNVHVQREYNDVRFVCEAYLRLLDAPPGGTYNVCSGLTHDFNSVLEMLTQLTGHRIEVDVDPQFVRANEVHRLCGDPALLDAAIGPVRRYGLQETLQWMLE